MCSFCRSPTPHHSSVIQTSSSATTMSPSPSLDKSMLFNRALFPISAVILSAMLLYAVASHSLSLSSGFSLPPFLNNTPSYPAQQLEEVLKSASMENNTVILTTVNEAWASRGSVFDLFLKSFLLGNGTRKLLEHLVVIALDEKAYKRCQVVHTHCFALVDKDVDSGEEEYAPGPPVSEEDADSGQEAFFMTPRYLKMLWRRIDFLRFVLELGYSFVFSDVDIMWFRDPFPHFFPDVDFQIACDEYLGQPDDINNRPNGGFNYVKSNNRTIEFYKFWYSSRGNYPGINDQDVLDKIKSDPFISDIGLKIRFLDTALFGGLCQPSRDLNLVCTMHANCCIGMDNKIHDLRLMLEDWRVFLSLPWDLKNRSIVSWRAPQKCKYSI